MVGFVLAELISREKMPGFVRSLLACSLCVVAGCSVIGKSLDGFASEDGACPSGLTTCSEVCVDTKSDASNCGGCGTACDSAEVCFDGTCRDSCPANTEQCGATCADTETSSAHCGACDSPCAGECSSGTCMGSCAAGRTNCSGACVDVQSNALNCGSCDNSCSAGQACTAGACSTSCPPGQSTCNDLCIDLDNNNLNCGSCGNVCGAGEVCGGGMCALTCPGVLQACAGSCVDVQTDDSHCGTCDDACASTEECVDGTCRVACRTMLNQPITDPWGDSWDGLERAAKSYDEAVATCDGIGGRLPTATELYRVSATQSATVGQTINTNWLWSMVPFGATTQIIVKLSDGATTASEFVEPRNYRCFCSGGEPTVFDDQACHGQPNSPCAPLAGEGSRYNIDSEDRAPVGVMGAVFECAMARGHLAEYRTMVEAIQQGLPNPTNAWLHTADAVNFQSHGVIRFADTASFVMASDSSWGLTSDLRPFRCVGLSFDPGPNPNTFPGEWVDPIGHYKSESDDTMELDMTSMMMVPSLVDWTAAHDLCWARGGHVPRGAEMAEMIQAGLPTTQSGSEWVWTSDQSGFDTVNFLAQIVRWSDGNRRFTMRNDDDSSYGWGYKRAGEAFRHRCIYYPIDPTYTGPADSDCSGGCTEFTLPGATSAKIWVDTFDRAPPNTAEEAIRTCWGVGGHLATERDLMETIRLGLPNGSDDGAASSPIFAADYVVGATGAPAPRFSILYWMGVDQTLDGFWMSSMTWSDLTNTRPFRCMWTNELR